MIPSDTPRKWPIASGATKATNYERNVMAYLALRSGDAATAQQLFARIGNDWSESVWKTKAAFDAGRTGTRSERPARRLTLTRLKMDGYSFYRSTGCIGDERRKGFARPLFISRRAPVPKIDTYRKQAKQLVRWHRERNYSIGEKFRLLKRYRHLTDIEALEASLPLTVAQEIVAVEAGFENWSALKASTTDDTPPSRPAEGEPTLLSAVPILFVRDVTRAASVYTERLGFRVDFLHGSPPFYGSVSRDGACLHLRFVHTETFFAELAAREESLILATMEVRNVKSLFEQYEHRGVEFAQRLVRQAWGGIDFHVRDLDGNVIAFVEYRSSTA